MKRVTIYLHSHKETNYEKGVDIGLSGEALNTFMYTGYEHEMTYEVNEETGMANLVEVDGRKVEQKQ